MAKTTPAAVDPATQEILRRLSNIEQQVTSIDETNAFAMRASRDALQLELDAIFGNGAKRAQVYLAANNRRTVTEIASHLKILPTNVSRELTKLADDGLLTPRGEGPSTRYRKKRVDQAIGVSRYLQRKFNLSADGLPVKKK